MRTQFLRALTTLLGVAAIAAVGGCDDDIVYRDRPPFNEPADPASGFVGYYAAAESRTTCGNCHADFQAGWEETAHAHAWQTLADIDAPASCYSCHTITERGNVATGVVGHDKVQDETYYDVQCESCHGPGLEHIEAVSQGQLVRPLANIGIGPDTSAGCAACHNGSHHPFVEQWAVSRHAIVDDHMAPNPSCQKCHEGRGALARWDAGTNYAEKGEATSYQAITCSVCHDPHGSSNPAQLRLSVADPDPSANLCMSCHLYRTEPSAGSSRANQPHGPQGAVLLGFAGWRPPNFVYDTARIYGSHATTANPNLCAGCHVNRFTVTDQVTGDFVFQSTGHQFEAIPCVDDQGVPTGEDDCAFTADARNWSACTNAGCHVGGAGVAANVFNSARDLIIDLQNVLWADTDADQTIDPSPTDQGYLPLILTNTTDLNPSDNEISAADGSEFNVRLCGIGLHGHPDGSFGTHNSFLCRALLLQSAAYLESIYGFLPAPPPAVKAMMDKWSQSVQTGSNRPIIRREAFPSIDR